MNTRRGTPEGGRSTGAPDRWSDRWSQLARAAGISARQPAVLALSGGADSVFLLHVLAQARPRPRILAVHVDHGLRGSESEDDAAFCARLCAKLSVPFARRRIELDPEGAGLEARAREARYRALADEARSGGFKTILTGHHEDDVLETLLQRWMRGTDLAGLSGPRPRSILGSALGASREERIQVVRPLRAMRREEVRRLLRDAGLEWREDSSNSDPRFTRTRVRSGLLPEIERTCGPDGIERLRAFAGAVERFEEELAGRTAHLAWSTPDHAAAVESEQSQPSACLERDSLRELAGPLQRRALWRLLTEGTGHAPSRSLLEELQEDLHTGRVTRRTLPGDWTLHLRPRDLLLTPPLQHGRAAGRESGSPGVPPQAGTASAEGAPSEGPRALLLPIPGRILLPDGRSIRVERIAADPGRPVPTDPCEVELDAAGIDGPLAVRPPRAGDRFHPLGAPGSRPLGRFLRDAGIPALQRRAVWLVTWNAGPREELLWVAGVRPCDPRRISRATGDRIRLRLEQHRVKGSRSGSLSVG